MTERVTDEEVVMRAMRSAGFGGKEIRVLTYTSWKDGIDIERPSTALMNFAYAVARGLGETTFTPISVIQNPAPNAAPPSGPTGTVLAHGEEACAKEGGK